MNIYVDTTLKYYESQFLNEKIKWMGGAYRQYYRQFVKPSAPLLHTWYTLPKTFFVFRHRRTSFYEVSSDIEAKQNPISLLDIVWAYLFYFGDEASYNIMWCIFFTWIGFISTNLASRTNLCQYCLISSEAILFLFINYSQQHGHFSTGPNLLAKVTA